MPPEMSTTATNPSSVDLSTTRVNNDPLATALHASRSRFMITDILSAQQTTDSATPQNPQPPYSHPHQQQQQHHAALQHYIAQQQHLIQQRHQRLQNQQHHHPQQHSRSPNSSPPPPPPSSHNSSTSSLHQHLPPPMAAASPSSSSGPTTTTFPPYHPQHHHPSLGHLPQSAALMGFSVAGGREMFGGAAAAAGAHYAAIHRHNERERLRELDDLAYRTATQNSQNLDPDDRSRSPQPLYLRGDNRDMGFGSSAGNGGGIATAGGGGDSSISGDQASTIDDSDSDCDLRPYLEAEHHNTTYGEGNLDK
ncbi:homeobox protein B-H2-like [Musca vetustissima]|uniref:homeobox protein B-H2-like n=1 Tax=Musca vetustissima TaxID=27455 RepID=UPI002AB63A71|nr:homeobox protein B-H2-like [Musca vetustissima]